MEWTDGRVVGPEGRPGHRRPHHHLREGAGRGLLHALHEPWHQHTVQEASEETSRFILISIPPVIGCVDLHCHGISWCIHPSVHTCQVNLKE